ncbi:MAG: hypothetical protein J2P46_12205 [Zavarzinella sp.]|nr:hypothetical protein [Zavarzinella sp.]
MFKVTWSAVALDQLAAIFVTFDLDTQRRVAIAVEALNRRLALRPFDEGEARAGSGRVVFIDRLIVGFSIDAAAEEVRIAGVTPYGR